MQHEYDLARRQHRRFGTEACDILRTRRPHIGEAAAGEDREIPVRHRNGIVVMDRR
jgi:hypothetical protein